MTAESNYTPNALGPSSDRFRIGIWMPYKLHSFYRSMIDEPPDGYEFYDCSVAARHTKMSEAVPVSLVRHSASLLVKAGIPIKLFASLTTKTLGRGIPSISYMPGIVSFAGRPYITDAEEALSSWVGRQSDFRPFHAVVERALSSHDCKLIVCWNKATVKSIEYTYETGGFSHKIALATPGVPLVKARTRLEKKHVTLLFLGSVNVDTPEAFYSKGGHIVLNVFERLQRDLDNVRLVIRARMPIRFRSAVLSNRSITLIESHLTASQLERLMWESDIMVLPSLPTPWTGFLDGMNHELPIVTTDTHANAELVESGKTGFVCSIPRELNTVSHGYAIPDHRTKVMIDRVWRYETEQIVSEMVDRIETLVNLPTLRREMGNSGRMNIAPGGRFSLEQRNKRLKVVLDNALNHEAGV